MLNTNKILQAAAAAGLLAFSGATFANQAECSQKIEAADAALADAKASGAVEAVKVAEASTLIAAAKVQRTFGEFQVCANKASKAEGMLR